MQKQYLILLILVFVVISFYIIRKYLSKISQVKPEKSSNSVKISKEIIERDLSYHKSKSAKPMLWISMISMAMLFAGFTSAIIVSKGGNENWIYFDLPIWFYISTIVILVSSILLLITYDKQITQAVPSLCIVSLISHHRRHHHHDDAFAVLCCISAPLPML